MENSLVLGRFAPSPSGRMHLGNVFTALLVWLSARSQGGRLLLRMEDLDTARCKPEYAGQLMEDLLWLGLDWDEGPNGDCEPQRAFRAQPSEVRHLARDRWLGAAKHREPDAGRGAPQRGAPEDWSAERRERREGPRPGEAPGFDFFQSRRGAFYQSQLDKLEAAGLLYPCFCSRAQLHAASAPQAGDGTLRYDGRCRNLSAEEAAALAKTRRPALRVRVPDEVICFEDGCQGPVCASLAEAGDFVLRRSDGVFAYQLAATADDGAAAVTEVVRGLDLLPSTPWQIWLMRQLGYAPPRYCHTPLLLAADGRRLAKRERDLDMGALRARLPGPQLLLGALAHLAGITPEAQPMSAVQLLPYFDWAKVRRENIVLPEGFLADYF